MIATEVAFPIAVDAERVRLVNGEDADAEAVARFQSKNRAHFAPWEPRRPDAFYGIDFWRAQLAEDREVAKLDRRYRLFVRDRQASGEPVIGFVHFGDVVRGAFQACHLGFGIDADYQGRGYMREALEAAIGFAWSSLRLHRIEASYRPENERSGVLLARLGFVREGLAKDYLEIDGAWRDHVLCSLTHPAWGS
ncbi:MAG: GNAT family N-acetyltransferase [Sandaracinaceae bacterium]